VTILVNNRYNDIAPTYHRWMPRSEGFDLECGTVVDMQIWRKASDVSPEQNRKFLVSLASYVMHYPKCDEVLRKSIGDWAARPEPRRGVDEMRQDDDMRPRAATDFARFLRERDITADVYCIPDKRMHQLVIRVLFTERPCIDQRVAVGNTMADLMDCYPTLSIDLMTLDPREAADFPLPKHAVKVDPEET